MTNTNSSTSTFRERLAWLRRMPLHWRILLLSQGCIFTCGYQYRIHILEREKKRRSLLASNNAITKEEEGTVTIIADERTTKNPSVTTTTN